MFQGFSYAYVYLVALLLAVALVAVLLGFILGSASGARRERKLHAKLVESQQSPTPLDSEQYYLEAGDTGGNSDAAWAAAWQSDWGSTSRSTVEAEASSPNANTPLEADNAIPKSSATPDIEYGRPGVEHSIPNEVTEDIPAWLTDSVAAETGLSDGEPNEEASVPSTPTLESGLPDADSVVPVPQADAGGPLMNSPNVWPAMANSDTTSTEADLSGGGAGWSGKDWAAQTAENPAEDSYASLSDGDGEREPGSDLESTGVPEGAKTDTVKAPSDAVDFGASAATAADMFEVASPDSETDEDAPVAESDAAEVVAQDVGLESEPEAGQGPAGRARTYSVSPEGSIEVSDGQSEDSDKDSGEVSEPSDEQDVEATSEMNAEAELERLRMELYRLETGAVSAWDRVVPQLEERIGELERDNTRLTNELRAIEGQMMLKAGHRNRPGSSG